MKRGVFIYILVCSLLAFAKHAFASEWYVNGKRVEGKGEAIVAAAKDSKSIVEKKDVMEFDSKKGTFKIKKQTK